MEVLNSYGPVGVAVVKNAVAKHSSSGKTAESVRFETHAPGTLLLIGRAGFQALEDGRGPRKSSEYGGFDKGLEDWLQREGFPRKKSKNGTEYFLIGNNWYSGKSLAWKINKYGDLLYRKGGGKNVYSEDLAKFVEELTQAVKDDQVGAMIDEVKGVWH